LALASPACSSTTEGSHEGSPEGAGGSSNPAVVDPPVIEQGVDPGRVAIHRLNNKEYNNTVRTLLKTQTQPASKFLAEEGLSFDNIASALGMTGAQYESYFNAARDLTSELTANTAELAKIMTCMPAMVADPCARQIVETFGLQVYRRPLEPAEVQRAMKVFDAELTRSNDATEAVTLTVRAMLSAASFLYRIEYDQVPTSLTPHPISPYELASRLSYLHWSDMPDLDLFAAAQEGALLGDGALEAQVDRMLADPKASSFIESFAGQWLDIRKLITHSVTPQVFPTYTAELSDAMLQEGYLWFQEFVNQNHPLSDWFTADYNYVDAALGQHYGMTTGVPGAGAGFAKIVDTTDTRRGFLGLASFLTHTSFPSRTSPTLRGVWVISELLCSTPPPPPTDVPKLESSATPEEMTQPVGTENVKARLDRHRSDPACSACHKILDPIGLGLERYDGVGRYRDQYGNGDAIDPAGVLPDGTPFAGPEQLGDLVGKDPRFGSCVANKVFTYALGREVEANDAAPLRALEGRWTARGQSFRNLLKEVVLSNAFRFRRGEAP
jgi:hypothetical protein